MDHLEDIDLVARSKSGDESAAESLLDKYKSLVHIKARAYYCPGAEREDMLQEGMIGLYKAMRDFRTDRETSFRTFADRCISRQMITAVRAAGRQKRMPLNRSISLDMPLSAYEGRQTLLDLIPARTDTNPEEALLRHEDVQSMRAHIETNLSEIEACVLTSYLAGRTYTEMACDFNRRYKAIDNALQRVKRKLGRSLLAS